EARTKLDGLKDPFLRQAEEQGQAERLKIAGELQKEAGLDRAAPATPMAPMAPMTSMTSMTPMTSMAPMAPSASPMEPKKAAPDNPAEPEKKPEADKRTNLEKATEVLSTFQQLLSARARVIEEREERTQKLLAALDDQEKTAGAYGAALAEAR